MGRAPCCDKTKVKRGPWSPEEDSTLKNYIHRFGTGGNWIALPHKAGLKRCGKSCRLRWLNYLRPDIKHGGFTEEEDNTILTLYSTIGSRWSVIASHLQGRTDNDVKNHWNTKLKKKLLAANTNHVLNFSSSTVPSAPFLPHAVDNYYYYYGNNPDVYNNYYDDQKNLVLDPYELQLVSNQFQVSSSTLPGLMEIPDQMGSSHELSSISHFGNRDGFCWSDDNGGGEEDDGFLMGLSGSGFSFNNILNGFDFDDSLSGVSQDMANSH